MGTVAVAVHNENHQSLLVKTGGDFFDRKEDQYNIQLAAFFRRNVETLLMKNMCLAIIRWRRFDGSLNAMVTLFGGDTKNRAVVAICHLWT